jgi:hypothetical protein
MVFLKYERVHYVPFSSFLGERRNRYLNKRCERNTNKKHMWQGIIVVFVLTFPLSALAGIVPCGTSTTEMCTLCHLVVGVDTIIDYLLGLIGIVGILMLVIGGITYLVSAGNQKMMTSAKTAIFSTLAGFAIVLLAWVVVNAVIMYLPVKDDLGIGVSGWSEYTCSTSR